MGTGKELKFMDKANWTDELKCYVCCRAFNKMDGIFTHHWFESLTILLVNAYIAEHVENQCVETVVQEKSMIIERVMCASIKQAM